MRTLWVILSGILITGCAAHKPAAMPQANITAPAPLVASAALVFDPPIIQQEPRLDLSRSTRGPAAFAGFEDTTTTYFYVRTDDRQTTDFTDRFEREGYSSKVGAIRR